MNSPIRKIIHIDMDAFFAAIEQRDNPKLRGKPVIVGGNPWGRGVVSTCSYEARAFGVHSAMASRTALNLCPHGIFLLGRMEHYHTVSEEIFEIFREFTDLVEPLSCDEAFLDVTENFFEEPSATRLAKQIQQRILRQTRLTASAGVSYNLFLAKVASGLRKPNGLTVITPENAPAFLEKLPVRKFYGIGRKTAERLEMRQIFSGQDLKNASMEQLEEIFGKNASHYHDLVRGIDLRPVRPYRERKSLGKETTFPDDLEGIDAACDAIKQLASIVAASLALEKLQGRTVTLKVRYSNFESITRSRTFPEFISEETSIAAAAETLLRERTEVLTRRIRLLGITLSEFREDKARIRSKRWIQGEFAFVNMLDGRPN